MLGRLIDRFPARFRRLWVPALHCSYELPSVRPLRVAIGNAAFWLAVLLLAGPPPGGGSAN